ncbi:MAG: translation initiation factor IF-2 N-terminal domain-containing protein, partial [Methylocystaceae bacterium]
MSKVRVHELAKEFDIPSKDMVTKMQAMGLDVKNHMSTIETSQADWVRRKLATNPSPSKITAKNPIENRPKAEGQMSGRLPGKPRGESQAAANSGDDKTRSDRTYQARTNPENNLTIDKDKAAATPGNDPNERRPQGGPGQGYGERRPQGQPGQGYGDRRPQGQPGQGYGDRRPQGQPGQGYGDRRPQGQPGQGYGDRRPQGQPGQGYGDRRPQGQPGQGYGDRRPQGQPGQGYGDRRPQGQPGQGYGDRRPQGQPGQ